jgi:hypothetical protein
MKGTEKKTTTRTLAVVAAITAAASLTVAVTACTSDSTSSSSSSGASGSSTSSSSSGGSSSGDGGTSTTLYERLGKRDGIAKAVDAIVAEELKDPEIASYFFFQGGAPANGHPTADQVKKCLTFQLSHVAGGTEAYPPAASETGGFTCRDMGTAHVQLHIPDSVFTKFLTIAGQVLTQAGVAKADIDTIAGVLDSTRGTIVDKTKDGGPFQPPASDAGGD